MEIYGSSYNLGFLNLFKQCYFNLSFLQNSAEKLRAEFSTTTLSCRIRSEFYVGFSNINELESSVQNSATRFLVGWLEASLKSVSS
jgi:hypothetical protein